MKGKAIVRRRAKEGRTDWQALRRLSDAEIEKAVRSDADASFADDDFWKRARLVMPQTKEVVTLRLDRDVLAWLRRSGKGYQTRINALLRAVKEGRLVPK